MNLSRRQDGAALFAAGALVLAALALVATVVVAVINRSDGSLPSTVDPNGGQPGVDLDDGAIADPDADPTDIVTRSADAMAQVTSVEFSLDRSGAPVFLDAFDSIAVDSVLGQFTVPGQAQAEIGVTVDGNLATRLGMIAIDDDVWLSNPVTGEFEPLPPGYDLDPSRFFDPEDGWYPLLANLDQVELVGVDDDGGDRYHVRGIAPADEVEYITVGLVRDQDVPIDLWVHPGTMLVTRASFDTEGGRGQSHWDLRLDRYGEQFTIEPPEHVRSGT